MSKDAFTRKRVVPVQVGDDTLHIRPLTGSQLERLLSLSGDEKLDGVRSLSLVCCFCACDESGVRTFTDDDLAMLGEEADFATVRAVAEAAMKASGLGDDEGNA
jgi:hypothetical protein